MKYQVLLYVLGGLIVSGVTYAGLVHKIPMPASLNSETINQSKELNNLKREVEKLKSNQLKGENVVSTNNVQISQPPAKETTYSIPKLVIQDPQIKIEGCKSEYNANKSIRITQVDKQLNDTKLLVEEIVIKTYKECTSNGVSTMPPGTSPEAFSAYISMIKNSCQNAYTETQRKSIANFDNLKKSEYDKLEQQLQQEYQNCLNK